MTLDELVAHIQTSRSHATIIDIAGVPGIGGQLRVTAIRPNATVLIQCIPLSEYLTGDWFPGLAYQGRYPDLGALVTELERWLGRPIAQWRNLSAAPLSEHDAAQLAGAPLTDSARVFELLRDLVRLRQLSLPAGADFRLTALYWRQIEQYGDWDPQRALRDQEQELTARSAQRLERNTGD